MLHTECPGDYMYISFRDSPLYKPDVVFGVDRVHMTKFLKLHLDILQRPGVYHITILEHKLPRLNFGLLEDDEWEAQKATFVDHHGLMPVDITDGPRRFEIEDAGVLKTFEVNYTVFHATPPEPMCTYAYDASASTLYVQDMPGLLGSTLLPFLLTNTYLSAGMYTYAHVTALPS